jgi:hypothetical protein
MNRYGTGALKFRIGPLSLKVNAKYQPRLVALEIREVERGT